MKPAESRPQIALFGLRIDPGRTHAGTGRHHAANFVVAALVIAMTGYLDWVTGIWLEFDLVYAIICGVFSLYEGFPGGIAAALCCAAVHFLGFYHFAAGEGRIPSLVWNSTLEVGTYVSIAFLLTRVLLLSIENYERYEAAQRESALRERLMAVVSHDLKNPLQAILMIAEALPYSPPDATLHLAGRIKRASHQMNRLITDLLEVARIQEGRLVLQKQPCQVATVVLETLEAMREEAARKSLTVTAVLPPDLPEVAADPARLSQVLANLVGNAIKFTPLAGTVEVSVLAADSQLTVRVRDTGPGMSAEELSHLFERFWRAERVDAGGTGLGLSIVRGLVEAHGGRVWATSEVGLGSTFHLTLPLT